MTIAENLNKIWSEFRKVGITDDLVVIEYLARLLLEKVLEISVKYLDDNPLSALSYYKVIGFQTNTTDLSTPISTLPRHPTNIPNLNLKVIQENLDKAINQAKNIPNLFNHHILFRLSTRQSGGRYPTPSGKRRK